MVANIKNKLSAAESCLSLQVMYLSKGKSDIKNKPILGNVKTMK